MSQERTPSDIFRELLQNPHAKHTPKRNVPQLGPMRRKKRRKTMIELPNKKPLTFEFERTFDDCSERQIAATFIEKIAPDDEKENAQKMAQKIRGNEKSSLVAKRIFKTASPSCVAKRAVPSIKRHSFDGLLMNKNRAKTTRDEELINSMSPRRSRASQKYFQLFREAAQNTK